MRMTSLALAIAAVSCSSNSFKLSVTTANVSVPQGGSTTATVTLVRAGVTGAVFIDTSGLPAGVTATPTIVPAGQNSATLVLAAAVTASVGASGSAQVRGQTDVATQKQTAALTVAVVAPPAFTVGLDQPSVDLRPDSTVAVAVTVSGVDALSGAPTLSITGLPEGVTAGFSAPQITGGSLTSTMTLTAVGNAIAGPAATTVNATFGSATATAPLTVNVSTHVVGVVTDDHGVPIAQTKVKAGATVLTTDSAGSFSVDLSGTYDLAVVNPGPSSVIYVYTRVSTAHPIVVLVPVPSAVGAVSTTTASATLTPVTSGDTVGWAAVLKDGNTAGNNNSGVFTSGDEITNGALLWFVHNQTQLQFFALEYITAASQPSHYVRFGSSDTTAVVVGTSVPSSFAVPMTATTGEAAINVSLTDTGITNPSMRTLLNVGDRSGIKLCSGAPPLICEIPVIANHAVELQATGSFATGEFVEARRDISASPPSSVSMAALPQVAALPATVSTGSVLSWTGAGESYIVQIILGSSEPRVIILQTSDAQVAIPDVSFAGFPSLPIGNVASNYEFSQIKGYGSVDAQLSQGTAPFRDIADLAYSPISAPAPTNGFPLGRDASFVLLNEVDFQFSP